MLEPLATRMRPQTIKEFIGQSHLLDTGRFIHRMISGKRLMSVILYGPPGTGKTTLARLIAKETETTFAEISAVNAGKKDMERIFSLLNEQTKQVIMFVDEIHRFTKAQQDILLPYVESGEVVLIGATTENPYHEVNPAIRSRCRILEMHKLSRENVRTGVENALRDKTRGLGNYNCKIDENAMVHLCSSSGGDLRNALNALDLAVTTTPMNSEGVIHITINVIEDCMQKKTLHHDKSGDNHYDVLSALQRSINGSDVDASLHYAARLIEVGDLSSLMRRLVVIANEDIGLANPQVASNAVLAWQAVDMIGLPEARILIGKLVVEMALSPKSNSAYLAMDKALEDIRSGIVADIPKHLRDTSYETAVNLGHGEGYRYPHDTQWANFGGWVNQQYLPNSLLGRKYYNPLEAGQERDTKKIYEALQAAKKQSK